MAEDIKSLTKKCTDLEKRLKFAEAKIKVIADSMTSAKDIEKYLDVLETKMEKDMRKGIEVTEKAFTRENEMSQTVMDANEKEHEKERLQQRKEGDKIRKEMDAFAKESVRQAEFTIVQARLATLESMVAGLRKK